MYNVITFVLDSLNPLIVENKTNVEKVKDEIEVSFQNFIVELGNQKTELFKRLDEIQGEK
jgi:hypothetical protein